jgi:hypothetical protein
MTTEKQVLQYVAAIYETIKETPDGAPGGILYAALMGHMSLAQFEGIMSVLIKAGLVRKSGHCYFATAK